MEDSSLRTLVSAAITLLESHNERWWSSKMRDAIAKPELNPAELLAWYGGMGSLNDLMIARVNGYKIECSDEVSENRRMDELRKQIHAELMMLRGKQTLP